MFAETFTTISQSINEAITNLEDSGDQTDSEIMWDRDVTSYLWQELPGDLPTSGWCMEANPGETVEASSLTLKAKGCTPAVRRYVLFLPLWLQFTGEKALHKSKGIFLIAVALAALD